MNYLLFTICFGLGWLVAILANIDANEMEGNLWHNVRKAIIPKAYLYQIYYILSSIVIGFIGSYILTPLFLASSISELILTILVFVTVLVLWHAALVDLICYQISVYPVLVVASILVLTNIILIVFGGLDTGIILSQLGFIYWPSDNLLAALIGGILFFGIIKITKGKGMGEGDLLIFVTMGLILGVIKLVVAFYVMVLTGCLYGLGLALVKRRFRGIKLPFVPFMVAGLIITLIFGEQIIVNYFALVLN